MRFGTWLGLSFLGTFVSAGLAQAAVWPVTQAWSEDAEAQYGQWIETVPNDIFTNPGSKYAGIATDCADAAYTLRIIFAAEHGYPVRFLNRDDLDSRGSAFDSGMFHGKRYTPLRAFIYHVNEVTGTATISEDTYPVQITKEFVRPGTLFVHAESSKNSGVPVVYQPGHVYTLKHVPDNGIITYLESTVPVAVRNLSIRMGIDFAPQDTRSGYRNWIWPDSDETPGLSDEQYHMGGWRANDYGDATLWANWQEAIQSRLRTRLPTAQEKFDAAATNLRAGLSERQETVWKASIVYQQKYGGQGCMSQADYENYSTPSRDTKLQEMIADLEQEGSALSARGGRVNYPSFQIQIKPGQVIGWTQLRQAFMTKMAFQISDPENSVEERWGLQAATPLNCPGDYREHH